MAITQKTMEQLAELSKLNLTDKEKNNMINYFNNVLLFINKLDELDTSEVEPMDQIVVLENIFREDETSTFQDRDSLLKGAPTVEDGCFSVPKVVE